MAQKFIRSIIFCTTLLFTGCFSSFEPIDYGKDGCTTCKMRITDYRFGGEVILKKGKIYKFDALECMISFVHANSGDILQVYVSDAAKSGHLIKVEDATFVQTEELRSPMGKGYLASDSIERLKPFLQNQAQVTLKWKEILEKNTQNLPSSPALPPPH